jgi:hypothetical protein
MDSTIGSYCTPSVSISITSQPSNNFNSSGTATVTAVSTITLSTVTPAVISVSNYSIVVNSCLPLSTKENDLQNTISLYPNPTSEIIHISTSKNAWINKVMIFDVTGKQVLSNADQTSIDVSKLKSGLYFVKIKTDQGEFSRKFIKE